MAESAELLDMFDARVKRRSERREFFKSAITAVAFTSAATAGFAMNTPAAAQAAVTDADILNFALNLEYLEAQFYSFAANGTGLSNAILGGTGVQGGVTGGRRVNFSDPVVARYAREIAQDEAAHVVFLRAALGNGVAVAQPAINIDGGPTGAFTAAARAAGLVSPTGTFDAYASDENFLLGAFIFEDVGVTAYKGASPLISNNLFVDAAAGILATEAFHAGIIRTSLYAKGLATPSLRVATEAISNARDGVDGPGNLDQGVQPSGAADAAVANIAPTDANGIALSRTTGQVLNIVYLTAQAASMGGFFPAGVNGTIRTSAAN